MPIHRSAACAVALLALAGLFAASCGDDTQVDRPAAGPSAEPTSPEPAPAPAEPTTPPAGATDPAPAAAEAATTATNGDQESDVAAAPVEGSTALDTDTQAELHADTEGTLEGPGAPSEASGGDQESKPAEGSTALDTDTQAELHADTEGTLEGSGPAGEAFPVTITSDGGTWTLDSPPQRIVSLSPAATEILFAIGAGSQVVAVDEWSTFPHEAPVTALSGFDPNIEAIIAYEPDLVVIVYDANDLIAGLTATDIPVLLSANPVDIESGYAGVTQLGAATGHADEAEEMIAAMRAAIAESLADAPDVPIRVYHELDQTYYSASSNSFIGAVYAALGTTNIADAADTDGFGFPQLAEEYIIEADPQLIVITDLIGYSAADVTARPGWESVSAVRHGNILTVNADIASRWGPRLPQFVAAVVEATAPLAAG